MSKALKTSDAVTGQIASPTGFTKIMADNWFSES
jgi:hypothetical protein